MNKHIKYISIILLISLFLLLAYVTKIEPLYSFSLRFNDLNFKYQDKQASSDVIFIKIDEQSVDRFGRWPWNRDVIAKGISYIDDSSILILDMVFSEPTSYDAVLAQSLEEQDNSVCGFFLRHQSASSISSEKIEVLRDSSLDRLSSQVEGEKVFIEGNEAEINVEPILSACSLFAIFSTLRDSDQLFRNYPLAFSFKGELYPSIGVQALRMLYNKDLLRTSKEHFDLAGHKVKTNSHGFAMLNYYSYDSYTSYSFSDLYDGKLDSKYLQNKVIILGITEVGVGDMRATPIGMIPGPLIHATFISNVINDELLYHNQYIDFSFVLLFLLLPLIWLLVSSISLRVIIYVGSYGAFFLLSKLSFVYLHIYIDSFYPLISLIFAGISSEMLLHQIKEQESKFIEGAFSSYLSPVLLQKLMKEPKRLALGGEKKMLTIFFSDIRSFTSISETMDPQNLTQYLNRYFTPMSDIVMQHHGMIDKYIGDALMAFYNAPIDVKNHAKEACESALEMMDGLEVLNVEFKKEGLPPINIGIGLNTAEVVVGNMGSDKRFNYTVIGDGVNLASRVEGINKTYGTNIIITEFTQSIIKDEFLTRPIEKVRVKGKEEEVLIYELLKDTSFNREKVNLYTEARDMFYKGKLEEALRNFKVLEGDSVSAYFIKLIDTLKKNKIDEQEEHYEQ
ncbi:adenylate/guanylate cyclase domain-containing protein [Sulfurimonas sp. MAG313]|nr:adenylate/guanylate cyclase domain-containing protein [Sulfurimonas sp. MAG313]MDF1881453.1 adenylate/guanylate cyclase domain-containing protein [Sulfurimonas sp. MAG313]